MIDHQEGLDQDTQTIRETIPTTENSLSDNETDENSSLGLSQDGGSINTIIMNREKKRKQKRCEYFSTKSELILFFLLVLLVLASIFFVYEYQIQEIENAQIVKIYKEKHLLGRLQAEKPKTILPSALSQYLEAFSKQSESSVVETTVMPNEAVQIQKIIRSDQKPPKKIEFLGNRTWMWVSEGQMTELTKRMIESIELQVTKQGYKFTIVNQSNWEDYLDRSQRENIKRSNDSLNSIAGKQVQQHVIQKIILLQIIQRNGGISIDSNIVLTQNIKWVVEIIRNNYTNYGRNSQSRIIGFYSPQMSSPLTNLSISGQKSKLVVKYPSISPYFLYVQPQSQFLSDFLQEYYRLLADPSITEVNLKQYGIGIPKLKENLSIDDLFYLASQVTLRKREKILTNSQEFAIDYYGLVTINQNYGPKKLSFVLNRQVGKIYRHISAITQVQLVETMGKIQCLAVLQKDGLMSTFFTRDLKDKKILNGSFLHFNVMKKVSNISNVDNQIFNLQILGYPVQNAKWGNLPKRLYTYIPKQPQESSLFTQIWIEHIRTRAFSSGFQFIVVTDSNFDRHISQDQYLKIHSILQSNNSLIYADTKMELICLSILSEKGGIWVDPFTILNQNLNWAVELYKDFKIWNRLNRIPRVLMSFNPNQGPYNWTINKANNSTKMSWNLSYDHSFIASQPKAQLVTLWLKTFMAHLKLSQKDLNAEMNRCQLISQWNKERKQQKLMVNSLRCMLYSKDQEFKKTKIQRQVVQYFRLWTVNGLMGLNKLSYFNIQEPDVEANTYLWKYPALYVQNVIGKIFYPFKLRVSDVRQLQRIFLENNTKLSTPIDSKSLAMKYFGAIGKKTIQKDGSTILQKYANYKRIMSLPKIVWIFFDGNQTDDNILTLKCIENIKYYGSTVSNFSVRFVTEANFTEWLPEQQAKQATRYLQRLTERNKTQKSNLKDHLKSLKQKFILLKLLKVHGGIMINKRVLLVQNLNWLDDIFLSPFINRQSDVQPQVFAFYSPGYSTNTQFLGKNKRFVKYPSLQPFFVAAIKGAYFIEDFIAQYMSVLNEPLKAKQRMMKYKDQTRWLGGTDVYYESFYLTCQFILRQKQKDLDRRGIKRQAIDHYGLYSINTRFFSFKLNRYFDGLQNKVVKQHLGSYPVQNLVAMAGPLRYLTLLPKFEQINSMINSTITTNKSTIMEGSFLHKYVFLNQKVNGLIVKDQLKPNDKKPEWSQLPKKIWLYQEKPADSKKIPKKLMVAKLNLISKRQKFDLQQINDNNIKDHIDAETYKRLSKLINISGNDIYRFHLYNLALLLKHGGIVMPSSYLVFNSMNFIKDVATFSNEIVFNRYGELPKVFLMVDTLNGPINQWKWTDKGKIGHRLGFTSEFIAAERDSELIRDWLKQLQKMISLNGKELADKFKSCGLQNEKERWSKKDRSLLINDALACVLANKQKELKQKIDVTEHYRLWGMSEQFFINKFENPLNLDGLSDNLNPFLWHYALKDVELITGPIGVMTRLKDWMMNDMSKKLNEWGSQNWGHPESFLSLHLQTPLRPYLNSSSWQIKLP